MPIKVSINLPEEDVEQLKALAERRRVSVTQAIRQAIACDAYFERETREGGRVLIEKDDRTKEVVMFNCSRPR